MRLALLAVRLLTSGLGRGKDSDTEVTKTKTFDPRIDILPGAQRRIWPELKTTPVQFTLYGGTALALRLAHRQSADFDFFSNAALEGAKLLEKLDFLRGAKVRQLEPNTLVASVRRRGDVQLSFFGGLTLGQVDAADLANGPMIKVASLRDVAGTKLSVIMKPAEPKDYVDIHALLTRAGLALPEMLSCARAIYGSAFDPLLSLKALAYHDDPTLATLDNGIKRDLIAAVRSADPARLPSIKPIRPRAPRK